MALGQFLFGGAISGGIGALMMKRSWHSFDARTCCKNCYGNAYITYIHNIYIYDICILLHISKISDV